MMILFGHVAEVPQASEWAVVLVVVVVVVDSTRYPGSAVVAAVLDKPHFLVT